MKEFNFPKSIVVLMAVFLAAPMTLHADASSTGSPALGPSGTGTGRAENNTPSSTDIDTSGSGTTNTQDGSVSPSNRPGTSGAAGTSQNERRRTPNRRRDASSQPTGTTNNTGDFNTNNAETMPNAGSSGTGQQQQPR